MESVLDPYTSLHLYRFSDLLVSPPMPIVPTVSPPRIAQEATTLTCDPLAEGLPYDPASQVTQILHQIVSSTTQINQAAYAYNPVGNRTSLTDRRGAQAFGYDTLDRLTSASHPLLATPQAFAYDAVGNRTTGGTVVNPGNQLTADATHSYQYDDNGNLTRKTFLATGNYTQYTYDAENRLTKVEEFAAGNPTPAFTSMYRYDGLGRRIEKVANGQTKRYIYDGEDMLLEYDGANVSQARYTHGPGIDEPIAVTKGGSTFFYHQDGLGTFTDLTDSTGATAKSYSDDAYGTIVDQTGTVEQAYMYTGRELDQETGLYYYRARYYDAMTGRFLQKDLPKFSGFDGNLYAYVVDNPAVRVDPFGFCYLDFGTGLALPTVPGGVGINISGQVVFDGLFPSNICVTSGAGFGIGGSLTATVFPGTPTPGWKGRVTVQGGNGVVGAKAVYNISRDTGREDINVGVGVGIGASASFTPVTQTKCLLACKEPK